MHNLLLFDVDGVLVHPLGYKRALQATIDTVAQQMGQAPVLVSMDEIAQFEAYGLTNEWDSAALCSGVMVVEAIRQNATVIRDTWDETLTTIREAQLTIPRLVFTTWAEKVALRNSQSEAPTQHSLSVLLEHAPANAHPLLEFLFRDIYDIYTPTTHLQQAHTLGKTAFEATYGISPVVHIEDSYLMLYDKPHLTPENRDLLLQWHDQGHGIAIFTARPTLPPSGIETDIKGYAPEGDFAMRLLDLVGKVPLIGSGRMDWLAHRYGRTVADYIKPSPVQALAAIGAAMSGSEVDGLEAAATFYEERRLIAPLTDLDDARVVVFEDSAGGIRSVKNAAQWLQNAGINITVVGIGIALEPSKRKSLGKIADRVLDTVNDGIQDVTILLQN